MPAVLLLTFPPHTVHSVDRWANKQGVTVSWSTVNKWRRAERRGAGPCAHSGAWDSFPTLIWFMKNELTSVCSASEWQQTHVPHSFKSTRVFRVWGKEMSWLSVTTLNITHGEKLLSPIRVCYLHQCQISDGWAVVQKSGIPYGMMTRTEFQIKFLQFSCGFLTGLRGLFKTRN